MTTPMDATEELQELWAAVFGEPPFIRAEPTVIAEVLVGSLPSAPPYVPDAAPTGVARQAQPSTFTLRDGRAMARECAS